ncbi:acyl-homoserine-lactone synthase [Arsenophonus nasoniae]|uniref:Acyl-homoserine-lactone synthase n=1 Tax=Arsenophonus nasoniae TaxID=638 RepID=A0ABY8NZ26_9GAMM|nr:acyl-homoserine-lactone synthase [Arsenophonus nasoniae]WGM09201.1 acyl-homoserine-lactone synthase [Arsenophonus nasoniae]
MIKYIQKNHENINCEILNELFRLRKKTFKDRLDWMVKCTDDMEFDEYDNDKTNYVLGTINNKVVCGSRLINMKYRNMLEDIFYQFFEKKEVIKENSIELTRIFIEKEKVRKLYKIKYPIILELLLKIRDYSKDLGFDRIYAVVTEKMFKILKKSGWKIELRQQGKSEKNEDVYLIIMPTSETSIIKLKENLKNRLLESLSKIKNKSTS